MSEDDHSNDHFVVNKENRDRIGKKRTEEVTAAEVPPADKPAARATLMTTRRAQTTEGAQTIVQLCVRLDRVGHTFLNRLSPRHSGFPGPSRPHECTDAAARQNPHKDPEDTDVEAEQPFSARIERNGG